MSAYMCSSKVLSAITDGILNYATGEFGYADLAHAFSNSASSIELDADDVFDKLYAMNRRALIVRYGNEKASEMYDDNKMKYNDVFYFYGSDKNKQLYLLYSCIETYLYQCSEGIVPSTEMYKAVYDLKKNVANDILKNSIGYKLANEVIAKW